MPRAASRKAQTPRPRAWRCAVKKEGGLEWRVGKRREKEEERIVRQA